MNTQPIEGFWCQTSGIYHYFVIGDNTCLCGANELEQMAGAEHQDRKPGREDCCKCTDIYREIHAPRPTAEPEPHWTVKQDGHFHLLLYQGAEQKRSPGNGADLRELARIFNSNGTTPKKKKKARCAADAPDPAKYIAKQSHKSPELPLSGSRPFEPSLSDFPVLVRYMRSLFDDSPVNSIPKPDFFDDVADQIDIISEFTLTALLWIEELTANQRTTLLQFLTVTLDATSPLPESAPEFFTTFEAKEGRATFTELRDLLKTLRFVIKYTTTAMSSKAKPKTATIIGTIVDPVTPLVETFPASHYRRYPTNRTPDPEAVKNMMESVRELGILQPIIARNIPGDPEIEILAGETRWLGCKALDPEYPVPCFLRDVDDKEAAKIHAVENFQRKDLNPIEEGREIKNMLNNGWEMEEIAKHLGKGANYLYKRLSLLKLPEEGEAAFLEGNLSLNTAMKILTLPEDKQVEAVKAVCEPTHAASALSERDALELLEDDFVKPLEKAAEWEERRDLLEAENPDCQWLKYEHAIKAGDHGSDYVRADYAPARDLLSDAARVGELVVPSWAELARKHGAPIYIGLARWGPKEALLFVSPHAIVEAEKAAFNDNPGDCIFSHEKAVQKNRDAAAKRKLEEEQRQEDTKLRCQARVDERKKLVGMILDPEGLPKTAVKKFIDRCWTVALEYSYLEFDERAKLFDMVEAEGEDWPKFSERVEAVTSKYIKSKSFAPFEAIGRIVMAGFVMSAYCRPEDIFVTGIAKPADLPQLHADYQEKLREAAEDEAAKEAAKKEDGFADGAPESNREEDAA